MTQVFYESWQLECCGTDFSVGDRVSWGATRAVDRGWLPIGAPEGIDWIEEHHQDELVNGTVNGVIRRIQTVRRDFQPQSPGSRMHVPVTGSEVMEDVPATVPHRNVEGYLVTVEDAP